MKILLNSVYHVSAYYGGNEHYLHHLAMGLQDAGHEVVYMAGKAESVQEYPYEIVCSEMHHLMGKPLPSIDWQKKISRFMPDVMHASGSGVPLVTAGWWLRRQQGIPTVLTFQAPTNPDSIPLQIAAHLEMESFPRAFSAIVTTGPHNYTELQSRWPWATIRFVPMMLADHFLTKPISQQTARKRLKISNDRKVVSFVGLLDTHHYYKGFDGVIEMAELLPDDYLILAVGEGNMRKIYEQEVERRGLGHKFYFAGYVPNADLPNYFYASDSFMLPSNSNSEGFGLVLLEAMACGVPTIMTDVIGSASWFAEQGVNTIISALDPHLLADTIVDVVENGDDALVKKASAFARSFTVEKMVERTVALYEELLG